jgi:hypothetical protein
MNIDCQPIFIIGRSAPAVDEFKAWIDATPGVQQLMANAFAIGDINADISHACVQEYADGVRAFCRERVPVDTAVLGAAPADYFETKIFSRVYSSQD